MTIEEIRNLFGGVLSTKGTGKSTQIKKIDLKSRNRLEMV